MHQRGMAPDIHSQGTAPRLFNHPGQRLRSAVITGTTPGIPVDQQHQVIVFFTFALPKLPGPDVMQGCGMHAFTFPMLTFLVSVDSGFQGIDEAGYHSCVRCCRYIRETQVNPQCRHDNNGGIARGATPESSGSYGFVRLEGDLLRTEVAGMSLTTGVHGAAGHSSVDVKDDDGSRAGTVRDDAGSLGGYLNLTHTSSGLWADIVAQGTRHSMKASSDNNDFRARGWGWLGSLETGLPFSITDNLMLEPQLHYTWQGLSLDDGQDNAGYVKFGHGSAQHVRAGFRLGSHNDMTFGEGTSSRDTLRDSTKHGVSELPVNWWVQPSVIRTFSSRGDMSMGTAAAGSNMTFSPSQNGTSLDLQAGLEARVRENITLGVQAGYAHSVSGNSAEGYNGQATLNVTF